MPNLGSNFYPKLKQMSSELGIRPEDLLNVMVSESGINPAAGKGHGAAGLVQFMPNSLKGVGFKGSPDDFRSLNGEEQLPYTKKLIQGFMGLKGGPFTSAAEYYVANLFPAALKLQGIKNLDPNTAFLEESPEIVKDSKSGKEFSKKYYDVGMKVDASLEKSAYKSNPLFHGKVKGAITFGDMVNQANKNARNPLYKKALEEMNHIGNQTFVQDKPAQNKPVKNNTPVQENSLYQDDDIYSKLNDQDTSVDSLEQTLDKYLGAITSNNKKLYNKYLPHNKILIKINSKNQLSSIEFARILCATLDEELLSKSFTYADENSVEVECDISGSTKDCFRAVKQVSAAVAEAFELATIKLGKIKVQTSCMMNKKSSYKQITLKTADTNYKKFLLKFKDS